MRFRRVVRALPVALFAGAPTGCATEPAPLPETEVLIVGTEYAFDAPDVIEAGVVRLRLVNGGESELHNAALLRLAGGHTAEDFTAWMAESTHTPPWATAVGGVESIPPGDEAEAVLVLEPGRHIMVCFHGQGLGKPHFGEGMITPVEVVEPNNAVPEPGYDSSLLLFEFGFTLTGRIRPGFQVIRVVGGGAQPHNLLIWRLEEDKVAADLEAWLESDRTEPSPARPVGGITALSKGERAYLPIELEPGRYALVCLVHDVEDGRFHMSHGMLRELAVS